MLAMENTNNRETTLPLVSIISINYNQSETTLEMLASLEKVSYPNLEVIIVDNASPSDNPDILKEKHPHIKLIKSTENLGFSGGNNLGIEASEGKYLLFLNNDTEVDPGFLEPLVNHFENHPNTGMASPKIRHFYDNHWLEYAGAHPISHYTGRGKNIGFGEEDHGQHDNNTPTARIHGAAMMIPLEVIKNTAPMPELYFLYYEEHDWCSLIKKAGYDIFYIADSVVYHKESVSVGKNSPLKTYYMTRNRLLYMRRNTRGFTKYFSILFYFTVAMPKAFLMFLLKREFHLLKPFFAGLKWNFGHTDVHANPELIWNEDGSRKIKRPYPVPKKQF